MNRGGGETIGQFLVLRSIPLRRLNADMLPDGMASGCLVEYLDSRWLLTVSHAVGDGGNWAVECGFEQGRGAKLYQLGQMNFAALGDHGRATRSLDLAYVKVPVNFVPRWQPADTAGNRVHDSPRELAVFSLEPPSTAFAYGFAGNVQLTRETHRGELYIGTKQVAYPGLRYVSDEDEFHVFELPFDRPADEWLMGSSGAPILDQDGKVVALVCGPGTKPSAIRGIAMRYFRPLLEIAVQEERSAD